MDEKILRKLGLKQEKYVVYNDSRSVIHLSKNSTFHSRSKHIDVRYIGFVMCLSQNNCIWRKYIPVRMG